MTTKKISTHQFLKWTVFGIIALRAILIAIVPLLDKTEARYGEIARLMKETGQWIVLQIDYDVVFWAKPPMSTWLSALSMEVFGVNEFAARLPSYLICLAIVLLIVKFTKSKKLSQYAPAFILLTTPEFLLHAGVVSTDVTLLLAIVITMLAYWKTMSDGKRSIWSYLFFVGIGLGLLAKGPLIIILTGPPIFIWCLLDRSRFKGTFLKLPWLLGLPITALIAVPWYWMAEIESPGFVDYFIVGEHFKRFTESGWSGDKYGFAKSQPLGMIWVFLFAFAFPWIQITAVMAWKRRKTIWKDPWVSFLLLWLLWTPVFFTISRNVIHTYVLPSTIPMALLVIHWWKDHKNWFRLAMIFPLAIVLALGFLVVSNGWSTYMNTDKYIVQNQDVGTTYKDSPMIYWQQKTYSGRFYAERPTLLLNKISSLDSLMKTEDKFFILITEKQVKHIPERVMEQLIPLESNLKRTIYSNKEN